MSVGSTKPTEAISQSGTDNNVTVVGTVPLPTGASTEATLALIKAKTDNLDVVLSTRTKPADQQHVIVDSAAAVTGNVGTLPLTAGGCSNFHVVGAGTGAGDRGNIKASPGQLYGVHVYNVAAYPIYVKFHDNAGSPTPGTGAIRTVGVQAGTQRDVALPLGVVFATGIAYSIVKGLADADATAIVAGDCVVDVDYK